MQFCDCTCLTCTDLSLDPTPSECEDQCMPQQCCKEDGNCYCINTDTMTDAQCPGLAK